jgi:hypothetical protein
LILEKEKIKKKRKMHCRPVAVGSDIGPAPTLVGMVAA